jgi:RimJ/RimL family protein N-acetyltransferase
MSIILKRLVKLERLIIMKELKVPKIKVSDLKLEGKRVLLRPLKFNDAKDIFLNIQDKRIAENTVSIPWPYHLIDAKRFIQESKKLFRQRKEITFGIEFKKTQKVIGCIGLSKINFQHKNAEIGYWLSPNYWNRGIMTESGKLILRFAFLKLKLRRLYGAAFSNNIASQKVFKKLNFKKEGFHRFDYFRFGHWKDTISYGLLKEEFLKK